MYRIKYGSGATQWRKAGGYVTALQWHVMMLKPLPDH
jgi:hypothetical protein